ncbi:hypothetical protein Q5P01_005617 [Channa striata]|uniref:Uncharacterized protein n=1 Tax=Channa striata TaxID=64152 RepID=A0AA88NGR7_CHASR|nr:hypothetical protein Q5P01_005617 [Channa striata]
MTTICNINLNTLMQADQREIVCTGSHRGNFMVHFCDVCVLQTLGYVIHHFDISDYWYVEKQLHVTF